MKMTKRKLPYMIIIKKYKKIDGKDHIVEEAHFEEKIKDEHYVQAEYIIDILNGKFVKKRNDFGDESKILEEYMKKYSDKIVLAVRNFFTKYPDLWKNFVEQAQSIAKTIENE